VSARCTGGHVGRRVGCPGWPECRCPTQCTPTIAHLLICSSAHLLLCAVSCCVMLCHAVSCCAMLCCAAVPVIEYLAFAGLGLDLSVSSLEWLMAVAEMLLWPSGKLSDGQQATGQVQAQACVPVGYPCLPAGHPPTHRPACRLVCLVDTCPPSCPLSCPAASSHGRMVVPDLLPCRSWPGL